MRLSLELDARSEPISGTLEDARGRRRSFQGWMEFVLALDAFLCTTRDTDADSDRSQGAGSGSPRCEAPRPAQMIAPEWHTQPGRHDERRDYPND